MKQLIIIFLVILCPIKETYSQSTRIDSLNQKLKNVKEDTTKVVLLLRLSDEYNWSYADTAVLYIQQSLALAQKLNYEFGIAWAQGSMATALTTLGNYPQALDYAFKSLILFEKLKDPVYISYAMMTIALCYRNQGDYVNSLKYGRKALNLSQASQLNNMLDLTGMISSIYEKDNQLDSAIKYAMQTYEVNKDWSGVLYVLGSAYAKKRDYYVAMDYYKKAIPIAEQNHVQIDLLDVYNGMSAIYKNLGKVDSAIYYATKAVQQSWARTYPLGLLQATTMLATLFQSVNKTDSALKYLQLTLALKDSLFNQEKTRAVQNLAFSEQIRQQDIIAQQTKYSNRLKMYAVLGIAIALLVISLLLWRNLRHRQRAYVLLQKQKGEIERQRIKVEQTLDELKATQAQLIQREKMASLGELTAGIAHEIQNPLNFVNNFSEVNKELIDELEQEIENGNLKEVKVIAKDIKENEKKITYHGKRADAIVKGMLQHSRVNSGVKESTDINALTDEYLRLAYHGLRAKDKSFNATMKTDYDPTIGTINIIPQDIGRVILNLITNAFYAVTEKRKQMSEIIPTGQVGYEPTVSISTRLLIPPSGGLRRIEIRVADNGNGIPKKIINKIFQPFFTTKPTGQGTGLGLSLSYDIVKAHGGEIKVETKEARPDDPVGSGEGSTFIIQLPIA